MVRIEFTHPESALVVERIRTDDSVFRLRDDVLEVTHGLDTFEFYVR